MFTWYQQDTIKGCKETCLELTTMFFVCFAVWVGILIIGFGLVESYDIHKEYSRNNPSICRNLPFGNSSTHIA